MFENKRIVVRYGDEEILSKKRIKMAPGEMERIVLPKALLDKANDEVIVEIVCEG